MSLLDDSSLAKRGLSVLVRQGGGIVAIVKKVEKEFSDAPIKDRVAMERWMQFWCDGRSLTPERFKMNVKRDKTKGIRIDEFKAYQLRAYGYSLTIGDKKIFIVTATDIKKKEKANPSVLDKAVRIAASVDLG